MSTIPQVTHGFTSSSAARRLAEARAALSWLFSKVKVRPARKSLKMCESLALGDRRFVAVIQVNGERFLIGSSQASITMLARLEKTASFTDALAHCQEAEKAL